MHASLILVSLPRERRQGRELAQAQKAPRSDYIERSIDRKVSALMMRRHILPEGFNISCRGSATTLFSWRQQRST